LKASNHGRRSLRSRQKVEGVIGGRGRLPYGSLAEGWDGRDDGGGGIPTRQPRPLHPTGQHHRGLELHCQRSRGGGGDRGPPVVNVRTHGSSHPYCMLGAGRGAGRKGAAHRHRGNGRKGRGGRGEGRAKHPGLQSPTLLFRRWGACAPFPPPAQPTWLSRGPTPAPLQPHPLPASQQGSQGRGRSPISQGKEEGSGLWQQQPSQGLP
jgi:hypothetical protein